MADNNENITYSDDSSLDINTSSTTVSSPPPNDPKPPRLSLSRMRGVIIILVAMFIIVGSTFGYYAASHVKKLSNKPTQNITVNTQNLAAGTLNKLTGGSQSSQELTISPNATFRNGVAIQGALSVGNNFLVSGSTVLQGPVSLGNSLNVHDNLSVSGNSSFGGNVTVSGLVTAASLSVGSITISNLTFNGDLNFGGHLVPTGTVPNAVASVAAAGGGVQISGNDTSGTIIITVGNSTLEAGEMAIITFHKPFNLTPQVEITPDNDQAAALEYYVTQSPTFFTIRTASMPAAGATYIFNYFVDQ